MVDKFKETGRRVFFDNFFTSVPLCEDLLSIGFTSVGTLRANKREIPDEFLVYKKKKMDVQREVGSCLQAYHENIMLTSWIPKVGKNILLLSSDPDAMEKETDNIEKHDKHEHSSSEASTSQSKRNTRQTLKPSVKRTSMKAKDKILKEMKKPRVVLLYNQFKAGVDLTDRHTGDKPRLAKGMSFQETQISGVVG
ncbi:uncharacterized protein LOC115256899 [Aedes albopictus]|uniref:PiggyBac transposable element-derived protein domain-containing protein n=1 Tax=Aedes albopictus TaxID=7160 RepID=A0ABM1Y1R5_AEDAL